MHRLSEQNLEKYWIQRRLTGPAYSPDFMRELDDKLEKILEMNVNIMHQRVEQSVDIDHYFNYLASGKHKMRILQGYLY